MADVLRPRILSHGLADADPVAWNRLTRGAYPYLRHEFLLAMETQGCLGRQVGWHPHHLLLEGPGGELQAALPQYLKFNSFGEFVFDWSWAEAHERAGLDYYPKLVVAPPFTPATGPRLLLAPEPGCADLSARVIDLAIEAARDAGVSSLHWLFATDPGLSAAPRLLRRGGCQFHWENLGYVSFDQFLERLTAKRRKEILRERRQARDAGLELVRLAGPEVTAAEWRVFHALYRNTFDRHGNYPALTLGFFQEVAATMGDQVMLVSARRQGEIRAVAYFLVGDDCLYGRYWGAAEDVPGLHFEACYYQGIEYCIERGLRRFEPGAQGEHKISRGFLPARTWSYHWLAEPAFREPVARFLEHEADMLAGYMERLMARSPYRAE